MTKNELRIIYMGTPEFAVESLRCLVEGGYNVVGVITMPDKPIGRHGSVLQASPVKQYAVEHGLPVLQPERLKDPEFVEQLRALNADLQIVVAFRMLPEVVWSMPRLGTFNLHASLLPQYRGAAPINWAIINGEKETGITTFFLKHEIDTGAIIDQVRIPIGPDDTAGIIHDRLMELGGQLVVKTVDSIIDGTLHTTEQETLAADTELHPAPKIFKETCQIDWTWSKEQIHNFVRGLSPYPGAWTNLIHNGIETTLKVFKTHIVAETHADHKPGTLFEVEGQLCVSLPQGLIVLDEVQLAGKRRMSASDFMRGFHLDSSSHVV